LEHDHGLLRRAVLALGDDLMPVDAAQTKALRALENRLLQHRVRHKRLAAKMSRCSGVAGVGAKDCATIMTGCSASRTMSFGPSVMRSAFPAIALTGRNPAGSPTLKGREGDLLVDTQWGTEGNGLQRRLELVHGGCRSPCGQLADDERRDRRVAGEEDGLLHGTAALVLFARDQHGVGLADRDLVARLQGEALTLQRLVGETGRDRLKCVSRHLDDDDSGARRRILESGHAAGGLHVLRRDKADAGARREDGASRKGRARSDKGQNECGETKHVRSLVGTERWSPEKGAET
jgi:uncharacterized membrane protein